VSFTAVTMCCFSPSVYHSWLFRYDSVRKLGYTLVTWAVSWYSFRRMLG